MSHPRFDIRRRLGQGAVGAVDEAWDHERGRVVAVKTLHRADPAAIADLKREFRQLADVAHPNLVTLYELVAAESDWQLVMERVDGVSLLEWIRGPAPDRPTEAAGPGSTPTWSDDSLEVDVPPVGGSEAQDRTGRLAPDLPRLRDAFRQLALGIEALHEHRLLHRDLKPSNVLVDGNGRVVVLDFGLVTDTRRATTGTIAGTAAYMAPEQAAGRAAVPASDWYAFGVMLFEALTGQRPFDGGVRRLLSEKQHEDAPPVASACEGVPADLAALCDGLLPRDPADRSTTERILAVFGETARASADAGVLGRDTELERLDAALALARSEGGPVLAAVAGPPGMGKSALVEAWCARVRDAVVLQGRCYERESVPFNAVDSLVDAIAAHLLRARRADAPAAIGLTADLFPALKQVPTIAAHPAPPVRDAIERRHLAIGALRDLVASLAPVVLVVDDAHWGDADSLAVYAAILETRAPLLVVATWREEEADAPFVRGLQALATSRRVPIVHVPVDALSPAAARELARRLRPSTSEADLDAIARESEGGPLFVYELAARATPGDPVDLDGAIRERAAGLPERARRLLDVIAVAGRPLPEALLATTVGSDDVPTDLALLRSNRLARTSGRFAEPHHNRVREAIVARMAPDALRACHRGLANAHQASARADPEAITTHLIGAGEPGEAAPWAIQAADHALARLAFAHAAHLYARAIALAPEHARPTLEVHRGDALAAAGLGAEAAEAWLTAAPRLERTAAVDLRRRAAEQLLVAGHVDAGVRLFDEVVAEVGLAPRLQGGWGIPRLAWRKLSLWWRGRGWTPRDGLDPATQLQLDVIWSGANGFAWFDPIGGADFQSRNLAMSLSAGDRGAVARALLAEAMYAGFEGRPDDAAALVAEADAADPDVPELEPLRLYAKAMEGYARQALEEAVLHAEEAERRYLDRCAHQPWMIARLRVFRIWLLPWIGRLREFVVLVDRVEREAAALGNRWLRAAAITETGFLAWMIRDDVESVLPILADSEEIWPKDGFHAQHFGFVLARCHLLAYQGHVVEAATAMEEMAPRFKRSIFASLPFVSLSVSLYRGRLAASAAAVDPRFRAVALTVARQLGRTRIERAEAHAAVVVARVAEVDGDRVLAIEQYRRAKALFEEGTLRTQAAIVRRAAARLAGDTPVVQEVDAWLRDEGVVRPERFAEAMLGGQTQADGDSGS